MSSSEQARGLSTEPRSARAGGRGLVLVVEDDPVDRWLLSRMLQQEGFTTLEAGSGPEALSLFESERPDLVFMDAVMPRMDGFETTRRIKAMAGLDFVPVIFQTALRDEESLLRGIQSGADDVLIKPFSLAVLRARILAMERVRDLHRRIVAENRPLAELLERERQEQALAERVFSRAIKNRNVATDQLGLMQRPAAMFSGDLVLTQHLPDGGLRVLVGDFTGHGLAAAIGALPVVDAFHAMTRKGVEDLDVLAEINRKLYQLLPTERFMAACLMSISGSGQELRWWNAGMPSAWLRGRDALHELASHALPLGILPELPDGETPHRIGLRPGDGLLIFSDGLLEARDRTGIPFGHSRFRHLLDAWRHAHAILPELTVALDAHCLETEPSDDIAILEIPLNAHLFAVPRIVNSPSTTGGWTWSLELRDAHLGGLRSVESMLRPLGFLDGLDAHLGALETIVAELYSNALEHGILRLPSSLKATPDGFDVYYSRRADLLDAGCTGWLGLEISHEPLAAGGRLKIRFRDSGEGFDQTDWVGAESSPARPWGRGIALVRELCESLTYLEGGRQVEAVYRWSSNLPQPAIPIE
ncbi:serine/threonine protein phosphatase [Thiocystis minor]|nr:serine/threonine protein phosphatase [Thiocystis minor]